MGPEEALLRAIQDSPGDELAWRALADCLEEQGEPQPAELARLSLTLREATAGDQRWQGAGPTRRQREARLQRLLAEGTRPCLPVLTNSLGMRLALVPPGSFFMGSPDDEESRFIGEGPRHKVVMARAFYLGTHLITQAQWRAVMGSNPSHFPGDDHPVEMVSWHDGRQFCRALAKLEKRAYRLPTETEWEHACRAGTSTAFHGGDSTASLRRVGWCSYRKAFGSARRTSPVGRFVTDPPRKNRGPTRCWRGGSWADLWNYCRSAYRNNHDAPIRRCEYIGLRICADGD